MLRITVLLSVLLSACGEEKVCNGFDTHGICLDTTEYEISEEFANWTLDLTIQYVNEYYPEVNAEVLTSAAEDENLSAFFTDKNNLSCWPKCFGYYEFNTYIITVGVNAIPNYIVEKEAIEEAICYRTYKSFAHEVIHFMSHEIIDNLKYETETDNVYKLNQSHMIPHLFDQWCISSMTNGYHPQKTECAEHNISREIKEKCEN